MTGYVFGLSVCNACRGYGIESRWCPACNGRGIVQINTAIKPAPTTKQIAAQLTASQEQDK